MKKDPRAKRFSNQLSYCSKETVLSCGIYFKKLLFFSPPAVVINVKIGFQVRYVAKLLSSQEFSLFKLLPQGFDEPTPPFKE